MNWKDVEGMFEPGDGEAYQEIVSKVREHGLIVEVGCLYGKSICSVSGIIQEKKLSVICCDVWDSGIEEGDEKKKHPYKDTHQKMLYNFTQNTRQFGIRPYVVCGTSMDIISMMETILNLEETRTPALVFLDNDHGYDWVSKELDAWYKYLHGSFILSGHDYSESFTDSVVKAVNEFAEKHRKHSQDLP